MGAILDVQLRRILDSRGNQTVEAEVFTEEGYGIAAAPSGASTGKYEVVAFPKDGAAGAVQFFQKAVCKRLLGEETDDQRAIDALLHELDGTSDFSKMGGNAAVALSLACAKAAASEDGTPLYKYVGGAFAHHIPFPFGNVLGGGRHAVGGTDIQEYMAVAMGESASDSVFANALVHKKVKEGLKKRFPKAALGKGDEGAWVAAIDNEGALKVVLEACQQAAKESGVKILPALDFAASEFFQGGRYVYRDRRLSPKEQIDFIERLVDDYSVCSVEDPLDQEAFSDYAELTDRIGDRCLVIGDDLFVTNAERIEHGIKEGSANAVLIKPNQIGTLTDTWQAVKLAHHHGYKTVISHRSGETTDETIAHLGVAFRCHGIKTGAVGGERIAKLNELIRISEDLGLE